MRSLLAILLLVSNLNFLMSGKILDLTWDFDENTVYWPIMQKFEFTKALEHMDSENWYRWKEFRTAEHGGTHLDAPFHFDKFGRKVGDIPVENLIAHGALIDVSAKQSTNSSGNLEKTHIENWIKSNGDFQNNTILLVKFGWSKYWYNQSDYFAIDENGNFNFPALSVEAASWIADCSKIVGVGVDTSSVDPGAAKVFKVHQTLSKKGLFNLENVKLLENLPARGFTVIALPMKLKEGTGGPVRVVAVVD